MSFRLFFSPTWHPVFALSAVLLIAVAAPVGCNKKEPADSSVEGTGENDASTASAKKPADEGDSKKKASDAGSEEGLATEKTPVRKPNPAADAALCQACEQGDLRAVAAALEQGADVEARVASGVKAGMSALMLAAYDGHEDIVRMLMKKGADVNGLGPSGQTALMCASSGPFPETVQLLLVKGAKVNIQDRNEGFTALMHAAAEGQIDVVRVLLSRSADPRIRDVDGDTAADFAARKGHTDVARLLKRP